MTPHKRAVKNFDARAEELGYVPRPLRLPKARGTVGETTRLLAERAHTAMLRRLKSS